MSFRETILRPVFSSLSRSKRFRDSLWALAHSARCRQWMESHPCKSFDELGPTGRAQLWKYVFTTCDLAGPINYLEFGVYQGDSIRWWVEENKHPTSRFVGFDSFQGLPTDWKADNLKGHFSTEGRIPDIPDQRCGFNVGYFNETLPKFLETFPFDRRLVVHLDADLYSSTLCVLTLLKPHLKAGDVLMFDEFSDSCNEFRAFSDFVSAFDVKYVPIANAFRYWHFALQIA